MGRLFWLAVLAGVLVAAALSPVVATAGIVVRNQAAKLENPVGGAIGAIPQRTQIVDSAGNVLGYVYDVSAGKNASASGVDRQPVDYDQIAPTMSKAIVAIEDDRFWHGGALDVRGTLRAALNDLRGRPVQGGSTLVQQYVKNMLILTAKNPHQAQAAYVDTLSRKLRQLRIAIAVEHRQSKQQILAGYLNDAYFGSLAYGVQVAARTYFDTTAAKLTLPQAATLAGIVENPSAYDPITNPTSSRERRNTVLARMAQTGAISAATAKAAEATPLALHPAPTPNGCSSSTAGSSAFFCQYVLDTLLQDPSLGATPAARAKLLATGGLTVTTTLNPSDQQAAANAVNYILPEGNGTYNPGQLADTEVLIQPGTGDIQALAEDRQYGVGKGQTVIDYAVGSQFGGGEGVQTGSSSKLFTLVTALEQGTQFGYTATVPYSNTVTGFTDCAGNAAGSGPAGPGSWQLVNASAGDHGIYSLYTGTTQSINTFFAGLEQKVGLCNAVRTAVNLGMHWADGTSLLSPDKVAGGSQLASADNTPSFTLGSVYVSPLSMADAYATIAARGTYCSPVAVSKIVTADGKSLPVPTAHCHRVMPATIADAVTYILQGVLTSGTAAPSSGGPGGIGRPAAGKTGTANVAQGGGTPYAAFAGYTPGLAGYVSVFNPVSPTKDTMGGQRSCYRSESGGLSCPGEMDGANAPAQTWHMTFDHANLGSPYNFVSVPSTSPLFSKGNGQNVPTTPPPPAPPAPISTGGGKGKPPRATTSPTGGGGPGGHGAGNGGHTSGGGHPGGSSPPGRHGGPAHGH